MEAFQHAVLVFDAVEILMNPMKPFDQRMECTGLPEIRSGQFNFGLPLLIKITRIDEVLRMELGDPAIP